MFSSKPSSSSKVRNLDHAFPPFALGLPSVYERAGFDVNRPRSDSRSSSRAGSIIGTITGALPGSMTMTGSMTNLSFLTKGNRSTSSVRSGSTHAPSLKDSSPPMDAATPGSSTSSSLSQNDPLTMTAHDPSKKDKLMKHDVAKNSQLSVAGMSMSSRNMIDDSNPTATPAPPNGHTAYRSRPNSHASYNGSVKSGRQLPTVVQEPEMVPVTVIPSSPDIQTAPLNFSSHEQHKFSQQQDHQDHQGQSQYLSGSSIDTPHYHVPEDTQENAALTQQQLRDQQQFHDQQQFPNQQQLHDQQQELQEQQQRELEENQLRYSQDQNQSSSFRFDDSQEEDEEEEEQNASENGRINANNIYNPKRSSQHYNGPGYPDMTVHEPSDITSASEPGYYHQQKYPQSENHSSSDYPEIPPQSEARNSSPSYNSHYSEDQDHDLDSLTSEPSGELDAAPPLKANSPLPANYGDREDERNPVMGFNDVSEDSGMATSSQAGQDLPSEQYENQIAPVEASAQITPQLQSETFNQSPSMNGQYQQMSPLFDHAPRHHHQGQMPLGMSPESMPPQAMTSSPAVSRQGTSPVQGMAQIPSPDDGIMASPNGATLPNGIPPNSMMHPNGMIIPPNGMPSPNGMPPPSGMSPPNGMPFANGMPLQMPPGMPQQRPASPRTAAQPIMGEHGIPPRQRFPQTGGMTPRSPTGGAPPAGMMPPYGGIPPQGMNSPNGMMPPQMMGAPPNSMSRPQSPRVVQDSDLFMQSKPRFLKQGSRSPTVGSGGFQSASSPSSFNNPGMPTMSKSKTAAQFQDPISMMMPASNRPGRPQMRGPQQQQMRNMYPGMTSQMHPMAQMHPMPQMGGPMNQPPNRQMRPQLQNVGSPMSPHRGPTGPMGPASMGMPQAPMNRGPLPPMGGGPMYPRGAMPPNDMVPLNAVSPHDTNAGPNAEQNVPGIRSELWTPSGLRADPSGQDDESYYGNENATAATDVPSELMPPTNNLNLLSVSDRRMSVSSSIYSSRISKMPTTSSANQTFKEYGQTDQSLPVNAGAGVHSSEPSQSSSVSFDFNQPPLEISVAPRTSTWYSAEETAFDPEDHVPDLQPPLAPLNVKHTTADIDTDDDMTPTLHQDGFSQSDLPSSSNSGLAKSDNVNDSMNPPAPTERSSGKPPKICRGCTQVIVGKSVRAKDGTLSGRWHKACLNCHDCGSSLAGVDKIHVLDDQPLCARCYHIANNSLCAMCNEGIEGQCLETRLSSDDGMPFLYHVNCLRCAECQIKLHQSYFDVDGAPYCAEHAFASLPDDKTVHKRYTQYMMI